MNKIIKREYQEIRTWIYRNARQVDLAVWQNLFERGSKEAVLSALSFYQNEDGGFGHALEADCWNPESSPYTTLYVVNIFKMIGFTDKEHPMMQGIIRYLENGKHFTGSGWLFSIPTNNNYAHAPWWTYNVEANEYESIGVTVGLACFVLKYCDSRSELYQKVMSILKQMIQGLKLQKKNGDMGIGSYCILIDTIKELGLEEELDYNNLIPIVRNLVRDSIERDTSKWIYYGVRPSNYIISPDSIFYQENEDIVQRELDYLIETRPENGVWDITWSWFDNNELYPKEFAISENWWKAAKAVEKMLFLRNFGRLE